MNKPIVECPYCKGNCYLKYSSLSHPDWKDMKNIDMYECLRCKSLTTYPMPSKEKLISCYRSYVKGFPERKSIAKDNSNQKLWYKKVLRLIDLDFVEGKRIADVGAGEGLFTEELIKICKNCEINCFDFHGMPDSLKRINLGGNKLKWTKTDVSEKSWIQKEKYDFVICNAVMEHVENPLGLLNNLIDICKKEGIIYVLAPCLNSWSYRVFGKRWVYIIPGEHLTIPSPKGLEYIRKIYPEHRFLIKKINPSYSTKYIIDSIFRTNIPKFLDFSISVPTGSFLMKIKKASTKNYNEKS